MLKKLLIKLEKKGFISKKPESFLVFFLSLTYFLYWYMSIKYFGKIDLFISLIS